MKQRVLIVHGWGSNPKECWFPWLKQELMKNGISASTLAMPHPETPTIKQWVRTLRDAIKTPDKELLLVGHSIGCQTILRYLSNLSSGINIRGAVLVAGWFSLTEKATPTDQEKKIAKQWLTPFDKQKAFKHAKKAVVFLSDNDPYVPLDENKKAFEKYCQVIVEHEKGHYDKETKTKEVPRVLAEVLNLCHKKKY